MNTTCPRCGTIILASQGSKKRLNCPTCQIRYCRHCQSWKERGQTYCLECGLNFSSPPGAIHTSVKQSAALAMLLVVLGSAFYRFWSPSYALLYSLAALGIYFTIYLVCFQRSTQLTWAARREVFLLLRQGIMWTCLAYLLIYLRRPGNQTEAFVVLGIGIFVITGLGLLVINRLNPVVLDELRANRATWKAVLAMRAMDALLLRFPSYSSS